MYQIYTIEHPLHGPQTCIFRTIDGAHISTDETHPDYLAFQEWVAEGNTPTEWTPEP
jgi:hypothetical protein